MQDIDAGARDQLDRPQNGYDWSLLQVAVSLADAKEVSMNAPSSD